MEKRVCVGKVASAHGVRGLVKIVPYCEDISLLNGKLFTTETGDCPVLEITIKNSSGKHLLASINGIDDKDKADSLKCSLYVSRETLPEVNNEDEFYIDDLIGLSVQDETGEMIGVIKAVDNFGAGDLLEIQPAKGGQTFYLPFHDDFVENIDIVAKIVNARDVQQFFMD